MAKKEFNLGDSLAAVLGKVSDFDQSEQITYIDLPLLDGAAENFYSMDGIAELAANIELIGLQQPLRVRENPDMPGRYLITSGHRRRAALWTLYEEDPDKWAKVACIVEQTAGSPQLQELRLIMANADTRKMSSADVAKQAERVQQLLYELKEQGYEFPGRMRDHVAEACKISSTKLAVLKVIRERLVQCWVNLYEKNQIAEATAYRLAQMPRDRQIDIYSVTAAVDKTAYESTVERRSLDMDKIESIKCTKAGDGYFCTNTKAMKEKLAKLDGWQSTSCRQCCEKCENLASCKAACSKCLDKKKQLNDEKREAKKKEAEANAAIKKPKIDYLRLLWRRWDEARKRSGLSVQKAREVCSTYTDAKTIDSIVHGVAKIKGDDYSPYQWLQQRTIKKISESADALGCSIDYLFGRTDDLEPWQKTPWISCEEKDPDEGTFVFACTRDGVVIPSVYWRARFMDFTERSVANNEIKRVKYWMPLPAMPDGEKWIGQGILEELKRK